MTCVFDDGLIQLYHGDAIDVVESLDEKSVACLLTDPPYGQVYEDTAAALTTSRGGSLRGDGARGGMRTIRRVLGALAPKWTDAAHLFVFCHYESYPDFFDTLAVHCTVRGLLPWWKRGGSVGDTECDFARDYELVIHGMRGRRPLLGRRDGSVLDFARPPRSERIHPTQKPVPLLRYLAGKSVRAGDPGIVLDPFAGSGSTLVACRQLGVRAVGIEVDERWIEPTIERLKQTEILPAPEPAAQPTNASLPGVG